MLCLNGDKPEFEHFEMSEHEIEQEHEHEYEHRHEAFQQLMRKMK